MLGTLDFGLRFCILCGFGVFGLVYVRVLV